MALHMVNYNLLHQYLRSKHPSPAEGQGGSVHLSDVPGLDSLIAAAKAAGHLVYDEPTGVGPYRYTLTAEGAKFLSDSKAPLGGV